MTISFFPLLTLLSYLAATALATPPAAKPPSYAAPIAAENAPVFVASPCVDALVLPLLKDTKDPLDKKFYEDTVAATKAISDLATRSTVEGIFRNPPPFSRLLGRYCESGLPGLQATLLKRDAAWTLAARKEFEEKEITKQRLRSVQFLFDLEGHLDRFTIYVDYLAKNGFETRWKSALESRALKRIREAQAIAASEHGIKMLARTQALVGPSAGPNRFFVSGLAAVQSQRLSSDAVVIGIDGDLDVFELAHASAFRFRANARPTWDMKKLRFRLDDILKIQDYSLHAAYGIAFHLRATGGGFSQEEAIRRFTRMHRSGVGKELEFDEERLGGLVFAHLNSIAEEGREPTSADIESYLARMVATKFRGANLRWYGLVAPVGGSIGFNLERKGEDWVVASRKTAFSSEMKFALEKEDRIVSIDGKSIAGLNGPEVSRMLAGPVGMHKILEVRRGQTKLDVAGKLGPYNFLYAHHLEELAKDFALKLSRQLQMPAAIPEDSGLNLNADSVSLGRAAYHKSAIPNFATIFKAKGLCGPAACPRSFWHVSPALESYLKKSVHFARYSATPANFTPGMPKQDPVVAIPVNVNVANLGKPVVLILFSDGPVQWNVVPDSNAKVERILLVGNVESAVAAPTGAEVDRSLLNVRVNLNLPPSPIDSRFEYLLYYFGHMLGNGLTSAQTTEATSDTKIAVPPPVDKTLLAGIYAETQRIHEANLVAISAKELNGFEPGTIATKDTTLVGLPINALLAEAEDAPTKRKFAISRGANARFELQELDANKTVLQNWPLEGWISTPATRSYFGLRSRQGELLIEARPAPDEIRRGSEATQDAEEALTFPFVVFDLKTGRFRPVRIVP